MKETITSAIKATGAVAVGFAEAAEVDPQVISDYQEWIAGGNHAGMDYLARHAVLKSHPRYVLEDAATVISIAYSYAPAVWRDPALPVIAAYAYGDDYHDVLRRRLEPVVADLKQRFGGSWRICIDSAPLAERYWAIKSGIGRRGLNGSVIVDGYGSYIFLVEILTSLPLPSDEPSDTFCARCGECLKACPQNALRPDGTIDCRRCLNYLTIEHRGDWEGEELEAMQTPAAKHTLFGCDICQRVCPHNRNLTPTNIPEFYPRKGIISPNAPSPYTSEGINSSTIPSIYTSEGIKNLNIISSYTIEGIKSMSQTEFSTLFKGSPIKRAKLAGFLRNASNLKS
ncbi:MAG: tRNA epoxyqueuosine(34) reductase QueG [Muribaculaceae bacterium]|nr:tRNA epoxyqueuosine(34) reductase QueG [Muribaculaceae bacterium]